MNLFLYLAVVINVRRIMGFQSVVVTCSRGVEDYYWNILKSKMNQAPSSPTSEAKGSVLAGQRTPTDPIPGLSQEDRGKLCESVLTSTYFKQALMEEYVDKNNLELLKDIRSKIDETTFRLNYRKPPSSESKKEPSPLIEQSFTPGESSKTDTEPPPFPIESLTLPKLSIPSGGSSPTHSEQPSSPVKSSTLSELSIPSGGSSPTHSEQPSSPAESLTLSEQSIPSGGSSPTRSEPPPSPAESSTPSKQSLPSSPSSPTATEQSVTSIKPSSPITQMIMRPITRLFNKKSPPQSPTSAPSDSETNSPDFLPIEEKLPPPPKYIPHYPYKTQYFNIELDGNRFTERMFPCLGRNRVADYITQYFISFGHKDGTYLVFQQTREGHIKLVALAEVLPELVPFDDSNELETYYVKQRNEHECNTASSSWYQSLWGGSGSSGDQSPVCALNDVEKLRTCTLIMSLPEYKEEVEFTVSPINVDCKCGDMKISFGQTELSKKNYREKAIGCRGKNKKTEGYSLYRVSASYRDEKSVFVYEVVGEKKNINLLKSYIKNLTVF